MEVIGLGFYYEDLPLGRTFQTIGRTVTEPDIVNFINCTGMTEVMFMDLEYVKHHSDIKGRVAPGALAYTFAEGLLIQSTMQHTGLAFLNMGLDIKGPVFAGDTIHVECEVIESRLTSKKTRGLVRTHNKIVNQKGQIVAEYTPLRMVACRDVS